MHMQLLWRPNWPPPYFICMVWCYEYYNLCVWCGLHIYNIPPHSSVVWSECLDNTYTTRNSVFILKILLDLSSLVGAEFPYWHPNEDNHLIILKSYRFLYKRSELLCLAFCAPVWFALENEIFATVQLNFLAFSSRNNNYMLLIDTDQ